MMRWAWYVANMRDLRHTHKSAVRKPELKISLGRPRHRWEENIKRAS
jgi:hypothetical protein